METESLLGGRREIQTFPQSRIWNLFLGNLVVFLHYVAANIQSPVLGRYLYERISEEVFGNHSVHYHVNQTCYLNKSDPGYILQEEVQRINAEKEMQFTLTKCIIAIFSNILLGAYSDSLGRRFLFCIPLVGHFLRYAISTCIIAWKLDLNFFFLADGIDGLTGSYFAILLASNTYTADNTPATGTRTLAIAVIEIWANLGGVVQIGTGYFIHFEGLLYPAILGTILSLLTIIPAGFLPESNRARRELVCLSPTDILKRVFGFYVLSGSFLKRVCFTISMVAFILTFICAVGVGNIAYIYKLNQPLCWDVKMIGYYATAGAIILQLIGVPLLRLLQLCFIDEVIGIIGTLAFAASYVLEGLAYNNEMMYGVLGIQILSVGVFPVLFSILSRMAPPSRQASLFASIAVVEAISTLIATPIFSVIYQKTVMVNRGFDFFVIAGVHVVVAFIFIIFIIVSKSERLKNWADVSTTENRTTNTRADTGGESGSDGVMESERRTYT